MEKLTNKIITTLINQNIFPIHNKIPLEVPFINHNGIIQNLIEQPIGGIAVITSKKDSVRSQHFHLTNWHYLYVIKGSLNYYERDVNGENKKGPILFKQGEMFFTPPNKIHKVEFIEDSIILSMAKLSNEKEQHDKDTVKEEF